jgi:hypothetical protein
MSKRKRGSDATAEEVSRRLAKDPAYQTLLAAQAERAAAVLQDEQATLDSLSEAGHAIPSLAQFLNSPGPLPRGVAKVLLDSLDTSRTNNVKQMIVRALIRSGEPFDSSKLAKLFESTNDPSLRWAIANTLAEVRPKTLASWIVDAVRNKGYGKAREMLALAVARTNDPSTANPILVSLLEDLPGHAALALAETGGREELSALQRAKDRVDGWQRTEIGKAISVIERRLLNKNS